MLLQQEQREWDAVNRLLQHHGFKPVNFADPTENKNLAGNVLKNYTDIFMLYIHIFKLYINI